MTTAGRKACGRPRGVLTITGANLGRERAIKGRGVNGAQDESTGIDRCRAMADQSGATGWGRDLRLTIPGVEMSASFAVLPRGVFTSIRPFACEQGAEMAEGRFVAYYRVSTEKQGRSGLGLEAQREAVTGFLNGGQWELLGDFTETETGKGSNALAKRPQLRAALEHARKHKATLVIAKLDRLARNVAFIAQLMEAGVDFIAVDNATANKLTLHILAAVAEHEREMISERTKAALAAAKARGTVLGRHARILALSNREAAFTRVLPYKASLEQMRAAGLSMREMVRRLNEDGVTSPGGGRWHLANLHRALSRVAADVQA
jgi:DNA invertase Pin-like site-specific DNA recombinase